MTSLLIHAALGLLSIGVFFYLNAYLFKGSWKGSGVSLLEGLYYLLAIGSVCTGWYFNVQYVQTYPSEASWIHFTKMLFTNPAAGSGAQDLLVTNAVLFPLWTMTDGPRRGLRGTWIYFTMSLVTSFGFAMGLYLAAQERQVRWLRHSVASNDRRDARLLRSIAEPGV
ncbi:MAG TPA: hypothetical protein DEP35_13540 [Deltaproteobacteria bacterium]|jgi:hypothetical protein|nr:hypothetical protein [Deltaproteobacteria bacterium]